MTTPVPSAPTDDGRWTFLEDTYWYVPTPYLPAVLLVNVDPAETVPVVDQTLWHIRAVENGYVIGNVASNFGTGWGFSILVGSISPDGSVAFSFTSADPDSPLTVGVGTMIRSEGQWFFEMQMTTGSGTASITHWAYMAESKPGDRAWLSLPGYPETGIAEVFAGDPVDTPAQRLINGTNGNDVLPAVDGPSRLLLFGLDGADVLTGSDASDGLVGGSGKDKLIGRGGSDDLYGGAGRDRLKGGDGVDYLDGGKGKDKLSGGKDGDLLHGGKGADRFIVADIGQSARDDPDTIFDFKPGTDGVDLRKIDARPGSSGDDAFRFIGEHAFTGRGGELRFGYADGDTRIEGDTDGNGTADLVIVLTGKLALAAEDFLL